MWLGWMKEHAQIVVLLDIRKVMCVKLLLTLVLL